jgi:hypothetical protein
MASGADGHHHASTDAALVHPRRDLSQGFLVCCPASAAPPPFTPRERLDRVTDSGDLMCGGRGQDLVTTTS